MRDSNGESIQQPRIKMKFIVLTFAVVAAVTVCNGALPENLKHKNFKTSAKQLNPLERFLIRTFHPEIKLNEILAQENSIGKGDNEVQDDYNGMLEFWNLDLPIFLLQLNKMGDEILLPTFHFELGFYFCFIGICSGFRDVYDIRSPVLKNVTSTSVQGSMNGTQIRVDFKIPDLEIQCPEFTLEENDLDEELVDTILWRGGSVFLKNFTLSMTANVTLGLNGLEVSNMDIEWNIDDLRVRYENGTHTFPDGNKEELGAAEDLLHELLMGYWRDEGLEEAVEEEIPVFLNCFLSNGRSGDSKCDTYLNEPLHRQNIAEIFHAFGLAALNKKRDASI